MNLLEREFLFHMLDEVRRGGGGVWGSKAVLVQRGPYSFGENVVTWGAMCHLQLVGGGER